MGRERAQTPGDPLFVFLAEGVSQCLLSAPSPHGNRRLPGARLKPALAAFLSPVCTGPLLARAGLCLAAEGGALLYCDAQASRCRDFSFRAQALRPRLPVAVRGLGGSDSQAGDVWALPGHRIKPVSPAAAGGFLSTAPPEKFATFLYLSAAGHLWSIPSKALPHLLCFV